MFLFRIHHIKKMLQYFFKKLFQLISYPNTFIILSVAIGPSTISSNARLQLPSSPSGKERTQRNSGAVVWNRKLPLTEELRKKVRRHKGDSLMTAVICKGGGVNQLEIPKWRKEGRVPSRSRDLLTTNWHLPISD